MQTNTAESYRSAQERKLNGPQGYKTTARLDSENRLTWRSYWRMPSDHAPAFCFRVEYHG